jgi:chromosome segregation ATPase
MARGGINKRLVLEAYETIQRNGKHPSIDAIRIELGNTGSKTTIHRYLKEIEEERGTRLDDLALLSDTLKEMVGQLAFQLHGEANEVVNNAIQRYEIQLQEAKQSIDKLQNELATALNHANELDQRLDQEKKTHAATRHQLQQFSNDNQRLQQQVDDLGVRLKERNDIIKSLEDKHTHARESLEHYRESVKEQRDQDQRRHEQQVQQLQAELRKLSQELIVKQDQLTHLNKDNARLASELRETKKRESRYESDIRALNKEKFVFHETIARLEAKIDALDGSNDQLTQELETSKKALAQEVKESHSLKVALTKAQSEADTKNQLLAEFKERLSASVE